MKWVMDYSTGEAILLDYNLAKYFINKALGHWNSTRHETLEALLFYYGH